MMVRMIVVRMIVVRMRMCDYVLKLLFCLVGRMIRSVGKVTDRAH